MPKNCLNFNISPKCTPLDEPVFSFLLAVSAAIFSRMPPGAAPGAAGRWPIMSAAWGSKDTSWMVPTAVRCRFSALVISDSLVMDPFLKKPH